MHKASLLSVAAAALTATLLGGCSFSSVSGSTPSSALAYAPTSAPLTAAPTGGSTAVNALIEHYAQVYDVPVSLVHRMVKRESSYNPAAQHGPYWGLMQIRHDTAITMGYNGTASGLLDADTNLKYAVKYLRGAWLCSGRNQDKAVRLYASGYYYDAKRMGLLKETGLKKS